MLANKAQTGATVEDVTAGGPAAKAGIAAHDIITGVEGAPLQSLMQIVEALARHKPGDSMELTIIRAADGTSTEVTMTLGANPNDASQPYMGLTIVGYLILVPDNRMTPEQQAPPAI
jgi:S1-C subfamily serine protease